MGAVTILRADGASLTFDAVAEYVRGRSLTVTDHPVEADAQVSDHVQRMPQTFTFRAVHSETPARRLGEAGGLGRVAAARAFLESCERTLVSVVSAREGSFPSMTIARCGTTVNARRDLQVEMELREVRLAVAQVVTLPGLDGSNGADVGEQPTTDAATLEAFAALNASITASISGADADATTPQTDADTSLALDLCDALGIDV